MIGNIIGIEENVVLLRLDQSLLQTKNFMNLYVLFEEENKIVGEITDIKDGIAYISLLGEIISKKFVFGVSQKPSFYASVRLLSKEETAYILSADDAFENAYLSLGESPIYKNTPISFSINPFFSNHFAIFGSTGSGKSWSVARIFQNLFEKQEKVAYKANIFLFDAYGEYHSAFSTLHEKNPRFGFKFYTTNLKESEEKILRIPVWLLGVDDLALLLGAEKTSQLPIIEKALKLVTIFGREEQLVIKYKNDIIARAILDILSSGKSPAQIRDQIFSILSYYHTKEFNLETPVFQPGYTRPFKQCLLIDASGKIREMELITNFVEGYLDDTLELTLPDGSFPYTLDDLKDAFDFALISEGVLKSDKVYDDFNVLKVRMHSLVNSDYKEYFQVTEYVNRQGFIKKLLTMPNGKKAQIINFNINYVDDRFAKNITKIYSKMLFDFAKELEKRASIPFHIVVEEAHRYVQIDIDNTLLGYNIFERITKEGRKYGVLLGLITQRPSELSETAISQCNNFLIFKLLHPRDVEYVRQMVPNITNEIVKKLRVLQPGTCVAFGSAFKVPVLAKLPLPDPVPSSSNCDIENIWFVDAR